MKTLKSIFMISCIGFIVAFSGCAGKEGNLSYQQKIQQSQNMQDMRPTNVNNPGLYAPYNHSVSPMMQ